MNQFDDDLDTMFTDFDPVTVVFGSDSTQAIRDAWDQEVLPGSGDKGMVVALLALLIKTSALPGLKIGHEVLVYDTQDPVTGQPIGDGIRYIVRDRNRPIESADGALTHLLLKVA